MNFDTASWLCEWIELYALHSSYSATGPRCHFYHWLTLVFLLRFHPEYIGRSSAAGRSGHLRGGARSGLSSRGQVHALHLCGASRPASWWYGFACAKVHYPACLFLLRVDDTWLFKFQIAVNGFHKATYSCSQLFSVTRVSSTTQSKLWVCSWS